MLIKQLRTTRKRMIKGGVIKQRYFRLLQREHSLIKISKLLQKCRRELMSYYYQVKV